MGIFGALEEIGRIVTGQTDEDKARRQAHAAWRNEHRNDYQCKWAFFKFICNFFLSVI